MIKSLLLLPSAAAELELGSSVQLVAVVWLMLNDFLQFGFVAQRLLKDWQGPEMQHWAGQAGGQQGSCVQAGGTAEGGAGPAWWKEGSGEKGGSKRKEQKE